MNLESLCKFCARLPGARRDIKWGADEVYSIGTKMFAVFWIANGKTQSVSFKVDDERFLELTDRPGIIPAPYLARAHWVQVERADALADVEARALVERSHGLVLAKLPRKIRDTISGHAAAVSARPPKTTP